MADAEPLIIYVSDITRAGYCAPGMRRWFHDNGLDFRDFMKNGIAATELLATGCFNAARVVELARERTDG